MGVKFQGQVMRDKSLIAALKRRCKVMRRLKEEFKDLSEALCAQNRKLCEQLGRDYNELAEDAAPEQKYPAAIIIGDTKFPFNEANFKSLAAGYLETSEFLRAVKQTSLGNAEKAWKNSSRHFQDLREQIKQVQGQNKHAQQQRIRAREELRALQAEVLSSVDRFQPAFDEELRKDFMQLNASIGTLVKVPSLAQLVLQDMKWHEDALWPNTVHGAAKLENMGRIEKRLLLRQALWKFFSEDLMFPEDPFGTFGGQTGRLFSSLDYCELYPDFYTNVIANKWRSSTVSRLNSLETDDDKEQVHIRVTITLAEHLSREMRATPPAGRTVVDVLRQPDVAGKLRTVQTQAIALGRKLAMQRAIFAVSAPDFDLRGYIKAEAPDPLVTSDGSVRVPEGEEEDRPGEIMLLGSPGLVKWGDGSGQNLDEETILVKAFVRLFPENN